ncbi:MAG: ATP-binding cassette domain-containing protein, partial [Alphaproteobacteria bacterium]|nr:ATP-binding cassette domain-containing protein [Alphaproteobacteria bacterium]
MSVDLQADDSASGRSGQPARIAIKDVGKRYGDLQVFQDINLEFNEREIVTVVGPSGCGKTTLLR